MLSPSKTDRPLVMKCLLPAVVEGIDRVGEE
jgi:hypothetical protein